MLKNGVIWLAIISALVPAIQSAHAQDTRLYQIISGRYTACCGIAGPFIEPLPNPSQEFIELTLDTQRNLAQMKFLAQDMHTVLSIPAEGPRSGFTYAFSNGMILPDFIRFEEPFPPPVPTQPYFSYTVTNLSDTLWINGTLIAPCLGCADIPEEFQHTNLVAILLPAATIRVSEVEVCWNTASNRTYQVQYRSLLTTNAWVDLGSPLLGNGLSLCITDKLPPGQPQRYYRVLTLPKLSSLRRGLPGSVEPAAPASQPSAGDSPVASEQ